MHLCVVAVSLVLVLKKHYYDSFAVKRLFFETTQVSKISTCTCTYGLCYSKCVRACVCMHGYWAIPWQTSFFCRQIAGYQGDLCGWHKLMMKGVVGQQNSYTEVHSTMHLVHPSDTQRSCHYSLKYVYTVCTYYIYVHTYMYVHVHILRV